MKRGIAFLLTLITVCCLCACEKRINPADYDEGPEIDAGLSSNDGNYIEGDPYSKEEIGLTRAYSNLIIALGDYDEASKCYVRYEYEKDVTYKGKPCYLYSRKMSKTEDGEYTHRDYVAVYKDGSMVELYK